jgi:hypothetical protein
VSLLLAILVRFRCSSVFTAGNRGAAHALRESSGACKASMLAVLQALLFIEYAGLTSVLDRNCLCCALQLQSADDLHCKGRHFVHALPMTTVITVYYREDGIGFTLNTNSGGFKAAVLDAATA